jgi:hypothetical protein
MLIAPTGPKILRKLGGFRGRLGTRLVAAVMTLDYFVRLAGGRFGE